MFSYSLHLKQISLSSTYAQQSLDLAAYVSLLALRANREMGRSLDKDPSNSVHDMHTTHGELYSCSSGSLFVVVAESLSMYCIIQNGLIVHKQGNGWNVH